MYPVEETEGWLFVVIVLTGDIETPVVVTVSTMSGTAEG